MKREDGFTLVELMAIVALLGILLTLGATAFRFFWLGRSLHGERDQIFTSLRAVQQQVVAESNPLIFGAWFKVMTPTTDDGSDQWGTFRYNPTASTCTSTDRHRLDGGVQVASVEFTDTLPGFTASQVNGVIDLCQGAQAGLPSDNRAFTLFLARGAATNGCVTLTQPRRDMDDVTVAVSALTGRVERIGQGEVATRCP